MRSFSKLGENGAGRIHKGSGLLNLEVLYRKVISFENSLIEASIDLFYKIFELKSVTVTPEIADITELYCQGAVSYLKKWIMGGFKESPEYISKITYASIPEELRKYL